MAIMHRPHSLTRIVATLLAITVAGGAMFSGAATATALQVDEPDTDVREIDGCTTILESGTYTLTEDIENSSAPVCIDIQADNVVFDGNGHTVDGNLTRADIENASQGPAPRTRVGVGVNVRTETRVGNVTVRNVTVTDWYHGVLSENVTGGLTESVTASGNGGGIIYDNSSQVTVRDSVSTDNVILGVIVDSRAGVPNADNAILNNTAANNGAFGAAIFLSNNSRVANNTLTESTFAGLLAIGTTNTTVANNTMSGNGLVGILVEGVPTPALNQTEVPTDAPEPRSPVAPPRPEDNRLVDNDVSGNSFAGLALINATGNTVVGTNVSGTQGTAPFPVPVPGAAVVADGSSDNRFVDVTAQNLGTNATAYAATNESTNTVTNLTTDTGTVSFESTDASVGPASDVPATPEGQVLAGAAVNTVGDGPNASLRISFRYEEEDLNGTAGEVDLNLYRFDASTDNGTWVPVEDGFVLNTTENTISGRVSEFGIVAPLVEQERTNTP